MPNDVANRPSKKQRELLSYIDGFIQSHGYGPSYREVMRALNYKSVSTVATHINGLIKKRFLIKKDNSARSLMVVDNDTTSLKATAVTNTQEKWLVNQVMEKFDLYESEAQEKIYDQLCVLTAALFALGLDEAGRSAKSRLSSLTQDQ